jgi:trimeric autotransporter adhesin
MAMISRIFRTIVPLVVASAAVSLLAPASLHAQAAPSQVTNRLAPPIDENSLVTLKGTVHPLANAANDRGAAPDSMPLDRIQIVLQRSAAQETALQQLIHDEHTPGTANYHKWLTPAQFGEQFGPSDQDVATIQSWLASKGFNVKGVNPGKQTLEISGSVAQFRTAFHTQIHKYVVNGETHYANATAPQIPSALAPVLGGFVSLNNFSPRRMSHVLGQATYDPKTGKATPQWTYGNSSGVNFVFAPGDFAVQYDLPPTITGTGQTIAIVNDSNINIALVNQFRTLFSLPANPPQVIIDGNDPGVDGINNPDGPNGDSSEAYLDVEWSGAVAPAATIDLVIGADTALESGLILAAEHAVYGNIAPVMSVSFGLGCESELSSSNQYLNDLWEQAAAQGITVMVSTGDNGSAGCDNDNTQFYAVGGAAVSGLASTPYNVAVGGTDFYYSDYNQGSTAVDTQLATYWSTTPTQNPATSILGVIPEQPWNDSQYGLDIFSVYTDSGNTETTIAGGSGGASIEYTKPAWQMGTGVPADGHRDLPDVSLFAADGVNASYFPICAGDGDCQPASGSNLVQITGVGGTSGSSPSFAGIMALVNQEYGRQGQADFVLYPLAAQFPAAFHDVTVGSNSVPCNITTAASASGTFPPLDCISVSNPITITDPTFGSATEGRIGTGTTPEFNATTGYDLASGLGSVDASVLITDWNKVSFTGTTVTLTSPTAGTSVAHGTAVTFTGSVSENSGSSVPTGNVAIETNSTEPGQAGQGFPGLFNNTTASTLALGSTGAFTGSISTLPGGTYDVWANYGGDPKNSGGASAKTQITITPEASGIFFNLFTPGSNGQDVTIPSGTTSIPYGTQIILSGLVAPSSKLSAFENCETGLSATCPVFTMPTGTVTFSDGGTPINTAAVNVEGEAEYTNPNTFSVGSHSVTASYSGDASYNASTAPASTFSIVKATPTIVVTGIANSSGSVSVGQGQSLTLTVLVEGLGTGIAPTGSVMVSGGPSGTPTSATLQPTVDPNFGVTAGVATITIPTTAPTTSSLAPNQRNGVRGWLAGSGAALACILLFTIPARRRTWRGMIGLVVLALFAVSATIGCGGSSSSSSGGGSGGGGSGGGSTGGTTVGNYTVSVSYGGDTNYNAATGSTTIAVTSASTALTSTTTVTSTSTSPTTTAAIGVTVTVAGPSGSAAPTGTVVLSTGGLNPNNGGESGVNLEIASGTLVAGSGASSTVSFSFSSENLLQGANLLTVSYGGSTTYASSSTTISLTNPLSDFSMVPTSSIVSVPATGSGTVTLNLAATNSFSGTVALTCTPPPGITTLTCSINPASVSLNGTGNSTTAQLTITGAAATAGNYQFLVTGTSTSGPTIHTLAVTAAVP